MNNKALGSTVEYSHGAARRCCQENTHGVPDGKENPCLNRTLHGVTWAWRDNLAYLNTVPRTRSGFMSSLFCGRSRRGAFGAAN